MRIAVDARALLGQSTGIGTYTRGISLALAARAGLQVGLFTPRPIGDPPRTRPSQGLDRGSNPRRGTIAEQAA